MPARPIKIVIVNDEPLALEFLGGIIQPAFKCAVITFESVRAALADLLSAPPDLLITDDKMPAITGKLLCHALLKENARYPIIVDSPLEDTQAWVKELAVRGLNVSLLCAPRNPESVLRAIEAVLNINAGKSKF